MTTHDTHDGRRSRAWPRQLRLPGQAAAPEGPIDMQTMYLMHHAFRRDLDHFVRAVRATPLGDRATWQALSARWDRFADVLHHHHEVEDASIWPVLVERARTSGNADDERTLLAMEAEHDAIDPALDAVRAAFAKLLEHPCDDHRNALDVRTTAARGQSAFTWSPRERVTTTVTCWPTSLSSRVWIPRPDDPYPTSPTRRCSTGPTLEPPRGGVRSGRG